MIVDQSITTLETSGLVETGAFSIKTTAAAFQLLSSGLYSNKIRAVIRELSCNAVDAHTSVKKQDVPIEIKMPNALDSQFYVKDTGPGLSHENIMRMYTTYFDSSKQASNDFIGGFGVGSKSPFAYTDSFTVESRHNGQRHVYSAFIGEQSTPQIALIGTFPMEDGEATGLTVAMPVKPTDFRKFEYEAQDLFKWFVTPPTVLGSTLDIESPALHESFKNFHTFAYTGYGHNSDPMVRMGNVVYPLNKWFEQLSSDHKDYSKFQRLRRLGFVLDAPIGSISVAASREELAYDKSTKEYLEKTLAQIHDDMMVTVVQKLQTFDLTTWQGRTDAKTFLNQYRFTELYNDAALLQTKQYNNRIPELNILLKEHNISPEPYLAIFEGLPCPDKKLTMGHVDIYQPYVKNKVSEWSPASAEHNFRNWSNIQTGQRIIFLDIDIPLKSMFADKARLNWYKKHPSSHSKTIGFLQPENVSDADYQAAKERILKDWGLQGSTIESMSEYLDNSDKAKLVKHANVTTVPATTFFSNKPSACSSDLKSVYYVEIDKYGNAVVPEEFKDHAQAYGTFVSDLKVNASVSKQFLKTLGLDSATLSRVYAVETKHIETIKAFKGALPLHTAFETGMHSVEFKAAWDALPVQRDESSERMLQVMDKRNPLLSRSDMEDTLAALKATQFGQVIQSLQGISVWGDSSSHNKEPKPDTVQYTKLGMLLQNVLTAPPVLPQKLIETQRVLDKLRDYYPFVAPVLSNTGMYNMTHTTLKELIKYIEWKDTTNPDRLIPSTPSTATILNDALSI